MDFQAKGTSNAKSFKEKKFEMFKEHEYRWRTMSEGTSVVGEVDSRGQVT